MPKNSAAWKKNSPLLAHIGVKLRTQFCMVLESEHTQPSLAELLSHSCYTHVWKSPGRVANVHFASLESRVGIYEERKSGL